LREIACQACHEKGCFLPKKGFGQEKSLLGVGRVFPLVKSLLPHRKLLSVIDSAPLPPSAHIQKADFREKRPKTNQRGG
jgi:hypothetical protein